MSKHRILLLNPPGSKRYIRDYYCSHVSKANYIWHPYDLFVQSGILGTEHEVMALDAIIENLDSEAAGQRIAGMEFDTVLMLTGAVSWKNDFAFARRFLSDKTLIATGDVTIANGREMMEKHPFLNATLQDFTRPAINQYLALPLDSEGRVPADTPPIKGLLCRTVDGQLLDGPAYPDRGSYAHPVPDYSIFPYRKYRVPHARRLPFASVMTDFGCPFHCSFCITGEFGYRLRDIDNVKEELDYLAQLKIRDLWFKDVVFGSNKKHYNALLDLLEEYRPKFRWATLSRVDIVTDELLKRMAQAGCHTIQFGVESGDPEILASIEKGIQPERVKEVFALCRRYGIRTLAHFILGLPGETHASAQRTIDFAIEIGADFASFNVATPRLGTHLRTEAVEKGYIPDELTELDNSVSFPTMQLETLSREEIWKLRSKAIRRFYLRPGYLWRRLIGVRSTRELMVSAHEGLRLLATAFRKKPDASCDLEQ